MKAKGMIVKELNLKREVKQLTEKLEEQIRDFKAVAKQIKATKQALALKKKELKQVSKTLKNSK